MEQHANTAPVAGETRRGLLQRERQKCELTLCLRAISIVGALGRESRLGRLLHAHLRHMLLHHLLLLLRLLSIHALLRSLEMERMRSQTASRRAKKPETQR